MATGLMVVALGRATRIARFIEATRKTYSATICLGRSTTTYDAEGETVSEAEVGDITESDVRTVLSGLVGELEQAVPAFSAVKVGGERLYAKARRGETVVPPTRRVHIHQLELSSFSSPQIEMKCEVSKGTYIRSLAVQIGDALGLPAHLSVLRRLQVGAHSVEQAFGLEDPKLGPECLYSMSEALTDMPRLVVDAQQSARVAVGRPLTVHEMASALPAGANKGDTIMVVSVEGRLLAMATLVKGTTDLKAANPKEPILRYECVLVDSPGSGT